MTSTTKGLATVRWKVQWLNPATQEHEEGTVTKYRYEDEAVRLRDEEQADRGFFKLNETPVKFELNLWSNKPWGRDLLFKELQRVYR